MASIDPNTWFLQFSSKVYNIANGDGRPWGDGTAMAARESDPNGKPWDIGCEITPIIGGYFAMSTIRKSLEDTITEAEAAKNQGKEPGERGYVYIADWRMNSLRDLSDDNKWLTDPWSSGDTAQHDRTAIGLILRLMQAGVQIRILLWLPSTQVNVNFNYNYVITYDATVKNFDKATGMRAHVQDHFYIARIVDAENQRLMDEYRQQGLSVTEPIGKIGLDARTASFGSHHQKMIVIRGAGSTHVAFCGGVDLAYTRRDAPLNISPAGPQFLGGDWQSGEKIPDPSFWPHAPDVNYAVVSLPPHPVPPPTTKQASDLPEKVYGDSNTAQTRQIWHDQHLMLKGPVVITLEEQFRERWVEGEKDSYVLQDSVKRWNTGDVIFSDFGVVKALRSPAPLPSPANGTSLVQMWRTIPLRSTRKRPPLQRGEYTAMGGIANACKQAKELIWIFDQYLWSQALTRLLNFLVKQQGSKLYVLVVLPPYADDHSRDEHHARKLALDELTAGIQSAGQFTRIGIYNLWHPSSTAAENRGIYCHAKVQTYDDSLLVCGSVNLNRRSLSNDSELACAVLDQQLVRQHQQNLWKLLFPSSNWPSPNYNDGWGAQFFDAFKNAAAAPDSFLTPDIWWKGTDSQRTLPDNVIREQDFVEDFVNPPDQSVAIPMATHDGFYSILLDPTSLSSGVESSVFDPTVNGLRPCRLDDIVDKIERPDSKTGKWVWRK